MKKAFTLLELVFVIVVIGILAAIIVPRTKTNPLQEAAIQLISDIRYTQHLAMVDDKYDKSNNQWYKKRWQILFGTSTTHTNGFEAYSIFSDAGAFTGNPGISELAKDPTSTNKLLTGGFAGVINYATDARVTKKMNLGASYGITSVTTSDCGGANRIAFDNLGRPFKGDSSSWTSSIDGILKTKCKFILNHGLDTITIQIEPKTGYVCVLNSAETACR